MENHNYHKNVGFEIILIVSSYITANIVIILIRLNIERIKSLLHFIGPVMLTGIVLASVILVQGVNYYLKNRELTLKETLIFLSRMVAMSLPAFILTDMKNLDLLKNQDSFTIISSLFLYTIALYILYKQLIRLIKNGTAYYKTIVKKRVDRLTISVTILGTIISLIALFK